MNEIIAENVKVMFMFKIMFKIMFKMFFFAIFMCLKMKEKTYFPSMKLNARLLKKRARLINKYNADLV